MNRFIDDIADADRGIKQSNYSYEDLKTIRREEGEIRQDARNKRGDKGQLSRLDALFGRGQGAKKERARLAKRLNG